MSTSGRGHELERVDVGAVVVALHLALRLLVRVAKMACMPAIDFTRRPAFSPAATSLWLLSPRASTSVPKMKL
jgi:hypothetical protein